MHLEQLEGLLNEVSQIHSLSLTVIDLVSDVGVLDLEEVHDWQNLPVVRHEGLADGLGAGNESLQDFQSDGDDVNVSGVQSSLNWDDELRNNGKNLGTSSLKHIENALNSKESVGVHLFTDAFKEDWQVVMIVELLNFDLPLDLVLRTMLNCNWEITSIVEESELRNGNLSSDNSTSFGLLNFRLCFTHEEG